MGLKTNWKKQPNLKKGGGGIPPPSGTVGPRGLTELSCCFNESAKNLSLHTNNICNLTFIDVISTIVVFKGGW